MTFISHILETVIFSIIMGDMNDMAIHHRYPKQKLNMTLAPRVFKILATNLIFPQLITREDFTSLFVLRSLILDVTLCSLI
jgi:hypothetical protein